MNDSYLMMIERIRVGIDTEDQYDFVGLELQKNFGQGSRNQYLSVFISKGFTDEYVHIGFSKNNDEGSLEHFFEFKLSAETKRIGFVSLYDGDRKANFEFSVGDQAYLFTLNPCNGNIEIGSHKKVTIFNFDALFER